MQRDNHSLWLLRADEFFPGPIDGSDTDDVANLTTSFNFHSRENFPGSLAVSISRMNTTAGKPTCGVSVAQPSTLNGRFVSHGRKFFVCSKVFQSVAGS